MAAEEKPRASGVTGSYSQSVIRREGETFVSTVFTPDGTTMAGRCVRCGEPSERWVCCAP